MGRNFDRRGLKQGILTLHDHPDDLGIMEDLPVNRVSRPSTLTQFMSHVTNSIFALLRLGDLLGEATGPGL